MKSQTLPTSYDRNILRYAFLFSILLQVVLWLVEENRYDLSFLWSPELFPFLCFTALFTALMVGLYYGLKSFRIPPRIRLLMSLTIGGLPVLVLIGLAMG